MTGPTHGAEGGPDPREARLLDSHRLLADAVGRLASSADWRMVLDVARRLPRYSPANCLLLAAQGAQGMVMGYHAWRQIPSVDGGKCQVRRGARGLSILAPATAAVRERDLDGREHDVRRLVAFRRTTVFDEQTLVAPPDLPDVGPQLLQGQAPERIWDAVAAELVADGFTVVTDGPAAVRLAPANGLIDFAARTVTVRPGLSPAQRAKTLIHELAHARLHDPNEQVDRPASRAAAEVEAESVAYLVLGEYGLDTADYTLPYLASWSGGGTGVVLATARRTVEAARAIIDSLEGQLGTPTVPEAPQPTLEAEATAGESAAWVAPPAPVADTGTPADLTFYSMPNGAVPAVHIGTPTGRWELCWDPMLASFTAEHQLEPTGPAAGAPGTAGTAYRLGDGPYAIPDLGRLEERLGFPLPATVWDILTTDQAHRPAWSDRPWQLPDPQPDDPPPGTRPEPTSQVSSPGHADIPYRQALTADRPLRTWSDDGYRLDILAAVPEHHPEDGAVRQQITYRLSYQDTVIFAGDDIGAPEHIDTGGDETIRAVIDLLCYADPDARLSRRQREFLEAHGRELVGLIIAPEPPYPPGSRVAVDGPAAAAAGHTGTVVDHATDATAELLAYSWRPDRTDLPGHPWQHQPEHVLVSPPSQVQPTLADRDLGLAGWTPEVPLTFDSAVTYLTDDGQPGAGQVLRAFAGPGGQLSYEVQPAAAETGPVRLPADHVHPTAGSAYPSIAALVAAREAAGVVLQPGEVIAVGDTHAYVAGSADGPQLVTDPPAARPPAPDLDL